MNNTSLKMKRFMIIGAIAAALLILLLYMWSRDRSVAGSTSGTLVSAPQTHVPENPPHSLDAKTRQSKSNAEHAGSNALATNQDNEFEQLVRRSTEAANLPVAFYGLVVDQDSNVLQNVSVDLQVIEERVDEYPQHNQRIRPLQRQTDGEGRFEVSESGLKGRMIGVSMLTKTGYEQEFPGQICGTFGPQSTSSDNPAVLRMWSTNMHEPLVTGEKSFDLFSDGRRYAINLMEGTMTEGELGDLVVWIRRPEKIEKGQRFDWDCEIAIPNGGLLESQSQAMFMAPEAGYTNLFAFQAQASQNGPGSLQDQRFYVQLRNGQMYGRIVISLYPAFSRTKSGSIQLSYAVNPSGSRLLR